MHGTQWKGVTWIYLESQAERRGKGRKRGRKKEGREGWKEMKRKMKYDWEFSKTVENHRSSSTTNKMNAIKITSWHIMEKLLTKEKPLTKGGEKKKIQRKKTHDLQQWATIRLGADSLIETQKS